MDLTQNQKADLVEMFNEFLSDYYHEDILTFVQSYPSESRTFTVSWRDIYKYEPDLGDEIVEYYQQIQPCLEQALYNYDLPVDVDLSQATVAVGDVEETRTFDVGGYDPQYIGELLGVRGQVTQLTPAKPKITEAVFECNRCGTRTTIPQPETGQQEPNECAGCERQGPYDIIMEQSEFREFQEARVKLPPEKSRGGDTHVDIHLDGDLANGPLAGNERIKASGQLKINPDGNENGTFDYYISTDDVDVEEGGYDNVDIDKHAEDIKEIANRDDPINYLANNLAPGIKFDDALERIATAIVMQMVGAGAKRPEHGAEYRGDPHILLLGDPGTAKSALLEQAEELAPRAKSASGQGLSKAGMTAAAVRDDFGPDEWTLKAGILVLANNGLACIDEIDKVDADAVSSAHSALETQRVNVMKAGIDAELPAETTLLAAGNPEHGRFDKYQPISEQIDLEPSLMSRFDLMFMLQDDVDPERDRAIAEHVVEGWSESARMDYNGEEVDDGTTARDVPKDLFQAYIAYARERVHPTFASDAAKEQIIDQYVEIRSNGLDDDSPVPVTARKLEAFLRLTEASARARLSETIDIEDAERAIALIRKSLEDVGIDPETGEYDADIVNSGTTQSQRERVQNLKQLIKEIGKKFDDGAPFDEVIEQAEIVGLDAGAAKQEIENLKQKGEVFEPNADHLRTSS